jgi:hypothetical protein
MQECKKCTLDLCNVLVDCDNIGTVKTELIAPTTGTYVLLLEFQDIVISRFYNFTAGQAISFFLPKLNENYCYNFMLKFDSQILEFTKNNKIYNNFNFCTKRQKNV